MKAIDLHSHCNAGLKNDVPETKVHLSNYEFLVSNYKNCGVIAGAFSYYAAVIATDEIYESNEKLFVQAQKEKELYQWLVLDPRQENLFSQIKEKIINNKVVGIKIHSPYHQYKLRDFGDRIFSFANELNSFVLMHPETDKSILEMIDFADKYPKMNLIIAHLSSVEHVEAIKNAKHGNIFTDTSGSLSVRNNIVEYAVESVGSEKIFFGTDTYACGFQKGRIEYANIGEEDKKNILFNNAKRYFARQFENIVI